MSNILVMVLGGVFLVATGCDDEDTASSTLPAQFEGAREVDVAIGSAGGNICDSVNESPSILNVATRGGELHVAYTGCFACEYEKHKAFVQKKDNAYQVLFSAAHIVHHNACGARPYTMRLVVGPGTAGDKVTVAVESSGVAKPVAEATAVSEAVDCTGLVACGTEVPCNNEGGKMDERADDYTMQCTSLEMCGGSYCIWDGEACMMVCGKLICEFQESYPITPSCDL